MDAQQKDMDVPFHVRQRATEREQPREMLVDQHAAVRSLVNKRQPASISSLNEHGQDCRRVTLQSLSPRDRACRFHSHKLDKG